MQVCVVCRGYATHAEERGKENFCMCDRFSADGFRTRAVRVIRRRQLEFGRPKGKKTGEERGNVQVIPGRGEKRYVCVGVRFVSAGRGPEGRFTKPGSPLGNLPLFP